MTPDVARTIELRPVQEADLDLFDLAATCKEGTGAYQWFGHTSLRGLRRTFQENGLLGPDGGVLVIAVDGRPAGRVEWFSSAWGPAEGH